MLTSVPRIVDHDQRRGEIADAVLRLVTDHGAEAVTMRSVAAAGGWSTGSIGHYFTDKDELLAAAIHSVRDRVAQRIALINTADAALWLIQVLRELLPMSAGQRVELVAWFSFLHRVNVDDELIHVVRSGNAQLERAVADVLRLGIEHGEFSACDCEAVAVDLLSFADGLALRHLFDPRRFTRRVLDDLVQAKVRALGMP